MVAGLGVRRCGLPLGEPRTLNNMVRLSTRNCSRNANSTTKLLLVIFSANGTPKVIGTLPVRTTDGHPSAQSQICYQRLQNQFDRLFVGDLGAPLVSAEDVLDLAAWLDRAAPADRAPTVLEGWRAQRPPPPFFLQATRHH
jgi:hypothetical protein